MCSSKLFQRDFFFISLSTTLRSPRSSTSTRLSERMAGDGYLSEYGTELNSRPIVALAGRTGRLNCWWSAVYKLHTVGLSSSSEEMFKLGCFSRIKTSDSQPCSMDLQRVTWICNQTPATVVFRDRYRDQLGRLRLSVAPFSDKFVPVDMAGTDTYYEMRVVVVSDGDGAANNLEGRSLSSSGALSVDSDDLLVYKKITVAREGDRVLVKKEGRRQAIS